MQIIKTKTYIKDLQKKIKNKHKKKEQETIEAIEELMIQSKNRQEVIINPLSRVYNIEKKQGNLKEISIQEKIPMSFIVGRLAKNGIITYKSKLYRENYQK